MKKSSSPAAHWQQCNSAKRILYALYSREAKGLETTLRQLQSITPFNQIEALKVIKELQQDNVVKIDDNLHDALQSRISLDDKIRNDLEESERRDAA